MEIHDASVIKAIVDAGRTECGKIRPSKIDDKRQFTGEAIRFSLAGGTVLMKFFEAEMPSSAIGFGDLVSAPHLHTG